MQVGADLLESRDELLLGLLFEGDVLLLDRLELRDLRGRGVLRGDLGDERGKGVLLLLLGVVQVLLGLVQEGDGAAAEHAVLAAEAGVVAGGVILLRQRVGGDGMVQVGLEPRGGGQELRGELRLHPAVLIVLADFRRGTLLGDAVLGAVEEDVAVEHAGVLLQERPGKLGVLPGKQHLGIVAQGGAHGLEQADRLALVRADGNLRGHRRAVVVVQLGDGGRGQGRARGGGEQRAARDERRSRRGTRVQGQGR